MAEKKIGRKVTSKSMKTSAATANQVTGFTDEERAAKL